MSRNAHFHHVSPRYGSDSTVKFSHEWPRITMGFELIQVNIATWLSTHIEIANEKQRGSNGKLDHICLKAQLPDMLALATIVHFVLPMKLLSGKLKH